MGHYDEALLQEVFEEEVKSGILCSSDIADTLIQREIEEEEEYCIMYDELQWYNHARMMGWE